MSDSAEEYRRYLRRCTEHDTATPLSPDEFASLLDRLDDLQLLGLERHLTPEESGQVAALGALLLEVSQCNSDADGLDSDGLADELLDPDGDLDVLCNTDALEPEWTIAAPEASRMGVSRMGSPCPDAASRRERWRRERRARG